MAIVNYKPIDINKFWERTPTPLKYILISVIFLAVSYFIFSKKIDDNKLRDIEQMKTGINATYKLIDNFEQFKTEQNQYNEEIVSYLRNLHSLIQELNDNTNKKFDMLLSSGHNNTSEIIEKITLLNESFNKISKIYQETIKEPKTPQKSDSQKKDIGIYKVWPNGQKDKIK